MVPVQCWCEVGVSGEGWPWFGRSAEPPEQRLLVLFKIHYLMNVAVSKYTSGVQRVPVCVLSAV